MRGLQQFVFETELQFIRQALLAEGSKRATARWEFGFDVVVITPEDFALRAVGMTAAYTAQITDAAKAGQPFRVKMLAGTIEQMWKDSTAYRLGGRR